MPKAVAGLLLLAVGLLALSFVEWDGRGDSVATAAAPTQNSTAVTPTPTAVSTATLSPAAYGRALFQYKGCASCHRHNELAVARVSVADADHFFASVIGAPELTYYQPDPSFVRQWLRDPGAMRPNTGMPNLQLSEAEIEALLAFLLTNSAAK